MDIFESEDDQVTAIKRFFSEYGKTLIAGLVLGLSVLFGWKYWQSHRIESFMERSFEYEQSLEQAAANGEKLDGEKLGGEKVDSEKADSEKPKDTNKLVQFIANNDNNYGVLAALQLAKKQVDAKEYDKALEQLQKVANYSQDDNLKALVGLRLARLQLNQKQFDTALETLAKIKDSTWDYDVNSLRGDIMVNQGKRPEAKEYYKKAVSAEGVNPRLQALAQMKLDNLDTE